jgi:hypothetical protein
MLLGIKDNILAFYSQISDDPNHRYKSWDHCYSFFQNRLSFDSDEDIDTASLHLAFYLASWGMYRGSSWLLWKDYKVHVPIVRELLKHKYEPLWHIDYDSVKPHSDEVTLFFTLVTSLRQLYKDTVAKVNGRPLASIASDTLITKILLGTIGCTPAYDRLVVAGMRAVGKFPAFFGRNSYLGVIKFYQENAQDFDVSRAAIAEQGMVYPAMKLIDMYFWNVGYLSESQIDA